jgi:hypothetical protein
MYGYILKRKNLLIIESSIDYNVFSPGKCVNYAEVKNRISEE